MRLADTHPGVVLHYHVHNTRMHGKILVLSEPQPHYPHHVAVVILSNPFDKGWTTTSGEAYCWSIGDYVPTKSYHPATMCEEWFP